MPTQMQNLLLFTTAALVIIAATFSPTMLALQYAARHAERADKAERQLEELQVKHANCTQADSLLRPASPEQAWENLMHGRTFTSSPTSTSIRLNFRDN